MIEHIANPDHRFFYPSWPIDAESLVTLAQVNPRLHAQAPQLIQQLADNMPALLLNHLNVCEGLGQHCALCNRNYQDVHALLQHMEQHHAAESQQCNALLKQLVTHFLARDNEALPCRACKEMQPTYYIVDNTAWHALKHKCAILQNLASLYLQTRPDFIRHGRTQARGQRRGQDQPDAGCILRYARRRTDTCETNHLGQEDQDWASGHVEGVVP